MELFKRKFKLRVVFSHNEIFGKYVGDNYIIQYSNHILLEDYIAIERASIFGGSYKITFYTINEAESFAEQFKSIDDVNEWNELQKGIQVKRELENNKVKSKQLI